MARTRSYLSADDENADAFRNHHARYWWANIYSTLQKVLNWLFFLNISILSFSVLGESLNYAVRQADYVRGNAGNSFYRNNVGFSAPDRDNDR